MHASVEDVYSGILQTIEMVAEMELCAHRHTEHKAMHAHIQIQIHTSEWFYTEYACMFSQNCVQWQKGLELCKHH